MKDKFEKLEDDIKSFCLLNKINDTEEFIFKIKKAGFDIEKYGIIGNREKIIEYVEKPVEVVKEVVKEISDEKVILENKELKKIIEDLKKTIVERDSLIENLKKINGQSAFFMRGSNLI